MIDNVAELATIGCIVCGKVSNIFTYLTAEMFQDEYCYNIFEASKNLSENKKSIDSVVICDSMPYPQEYRLFIAQCVDIADTISDSRADFYAHIVLENWRKRTFSNALYQLSVNSSGHGTLMKDLIIDARKTIEFQEQIEKTLEDSTHKSIEENAYNWVEWYHSKKTSIDTGFSNIDRVMGGWEKNGLYIIAGRPGEGKTDFAINVALRIALSGRVSYNTIEMTSLQITQRFISRLSSVDNYKMRNKSMTDDELVRVNKAIAGINNNKICIDDAEEISASIIKEKIIKHRPMAIIIDNMQNMTLENSKKSLWEAVAETSTMLKRIAKTYNTMIILLVQETREGGKEKAPTLAGLAGSAQLERDADGVLILRTERNEQDSILSGEDNFLTHVHICKNRHGAGAGNICDFRWYPQYSKFLEVDYNHGY